MTVVVPLWLYMAADVAAVVMPLVVVRLVVRRGRR